MAATPRAWVMRSVVLGLAAMGVVMALGGARGFAQAPAGKTPTFTKDIAPIFQNKCEVCHRPDNMAPMSLISYEDARPWARAIKTQTAQRNMPPWYISRTVGIQQFKNDPSLSDQEIALISRWVDKCKRLARHDLLPTLCSRPAFRTQQRCELAAYFDPGIN